MKADLLITLSPICNFPKIDNWNIVTAIHPFDAIPLVGLYLRQQNKFVTYHEPSLGGPAKPERTRSDERSIFYWKAADILVPAAARGPSSHRIEFENDFPTIIDLRSAVIWRVEQALQARDKLLSTLAVAPRDHTIADAAAADLELMLIWLMAGFDVTARIAHIGYDLGGSQNNAGWQRKDWRRSLSPRNADLALFFSPNSPAGVIVKLIASLRNSIHGGNPVSAVPITPVFGRHAMQPFVKIPPPDKDNVLNAVQSLGSYGNFGIFKPYPNLDYHIHPGEFAEKIFILAVVAISASLEHNPDMNRRSSLDGPGFELQYHEKRILWQLGFNETDVPERSRPSQEDLFNLRKILERREDMT